MAQKDKAARPALKGHITPLNRQYAPSEAPIRFACELLGIIRINGASSETVRQWRNGTRRAPRWFVTWLGEQCQAREIAFGEACKALAGYRGGPGQGESLRRWHRARGHNVSRKETD
jgi:hypothetical protein